MKKNAQEYLPPLLSALSEQYHLPFKRVKITGSKEDGEVVREQAVSIFPVI